jgi:RNA recognition motif-containing protein
MSQRLYVGNLSFHCNQETLRAAFAEAGVVEDVRIIMDRETGQSRGFAFVTMGSLEAGRNAIATLNGAVIDGRPLRVNEAEDRGRPGASGASTPRTRNSGASYGGNAGMRSPGAGSPVTHGAEPATDADGGEVIGNPRPGGHRGW